MTCNFLKNPWSSHPPSRRLWPLPPKLLWLVRDVPRNIERVNSVCLKLGFGRRDQRCHNRITVQRALRERQAAASEVLLTQKNKNTLLCAVPLHVCSHVRPKISPLLFMLQLFIDIGALFQVSAGFHPTSFSGSSEEKRFFAKAVYFFRVFLTWKGNLKKREAKRNSGKRNRRSPVVVLFPQNANICKTSSVFYVESDFTVL